MQPSDGNGNLEKMNNSDNNNSINVNEIRVDLQRQSSTVGLKYLPRWPLVNLEFQDIVYSVPELTKGKKLVLRGTTGKFQSNQLTAILGPSGSGKTTLLNVLAGYKCSDATGQIVINGQPRDMRVFRKMSRYIMQNEMINPNLTVRESMTISADLKLGNDLTKSEKGEVIDEILETLRLVKSQNTRTKCLSGGERKRLSIALELVNNPPLIFLDEPTTGLDDQASSQCIALLRRIAHGGRTIICSVHTPSAKIFEMFDHVYVMAEGQCVYQGAGSHIVPYMQSFGLDCPITYNPADFIVEVACGEYGFDYVEKMVTAIDNGHCHRWEPYMPIDPVSNQLDENKTSNERLLEMFEEEIDEKLLKSRSTFWQQFSVLFRRMTLEMWRDSNYVKLKFYMTVILGVIVGCLYQGVGNDASKALFNFGFAFTIIIAFMYKPMMPVLLQFPTEVQLLKREYFNQWYGLGPYYSAMIISKLPIQFVLAFIYLTMIYFMSSQPLEFSRIAMLYSVSLLVSMCSDSFGMLIASRLNIVNAMFVGPVLTVPIMLLSCYGIGYGKEVYISPYIRFFMSLSYLRHGMEGLIYALYGNNRADTVCPESEIFCIFRKSKVLMEVLGFKDADYLISICALAGYYTIFTLAAFYMIKRRLSFNSSNYVAVQYLGQFVKTHLNFASYKY